MSPFARKLQQARKTSIVPGYTNNYMASPSAYGWPDATNTGVQSGITLTRVPQDATTGTGWSWDSRGWLSVWGVNGATVENLEVTGGINIEANNIRLRNVRVIANGDRWGVGLLHTTGTTIEYCEIAPLVADTRLEVGIKDVYGDSSGTTVQYNDIQGASTGIQTHEGLIYFNYVHDLRWQGEDHVNGMTTNGGTAALTVHKNTILCVHSQTDAISLFQDFGVQANKTVTDNLVAGGAYTIYCGAGSFGVSTNMVFTGNRVSRIYFTDGGYYGPAWFYDQAGSGNVWSGNVWDDDGSLISVPGN